MNGTIPQVTGPQSETARRVGDLKVGDRVLCEDGKYRKVTAIGTWGSCSRFLSIDGKPDGAYLRSYPVEIQEA